MAMIFKPLCSNRFKISPISPRLMVLGLKKTNVLSMLHLDSFLLVAAVSFPPSARFDNDALSGYFDLAGLRYDDGKIFSAFKFVDLYIFKSDQHTKTFCVFSVEVFCVSIEIIISEFVERFFDFRLWISVVDDFAALFGMYLSVSSPIVKSVGNV